MGKVIGHTRKEGGLYLFEAKSGTRCPTPHTYLSEHPTPTKDQVRLSHFLSWSSTFLIVENFPNMFEKLNV